MRAVAITVMLTLVGILAGCLDGEPATTKEAAPEPQPRLTLDAQTVDGSTPIFWDGNELGEGDQEQRTLQVEVPEGYWDTHTGALEVSLRYDQRDYASFTLTLEDETGYEEEGQGWIDMVALVASPQSGNYTVTIGVDYGMASYEAVAQIEARPKDAGPVRDLLPNLVTLKPTDLNFFTAGSCMYVVVTYACPPSPQGALGVRGCSLYEYVEEGHRKCLRFSNRIGNTGEGAFEVVLKDGQLAQSYAGKGQWQQVIYRSDGTTRIEEVGEAAYHATHGHFHYQGMAHYKLYKYDLAAHERGDAVSEGRKVGFCFIDMGLVALGLPHTTYPTYGSSSEAGCGLSPNWYDLYYYGLDEQFIDVTGLPDGMYELVSTANFYGTAIESDKTDNSASVVFRMTGFQAKILPNEPPEE